jgi:hypothetical protein
MDQFHLTGAGPLGPLHLLFLATVVLLLGARRWPR